MKPTTWYYAIDADDQPHRLPPATFENAYLEGQRPTIPQEFERDPGGALIAGVLVLAGQGRTVVERASAFAIRIREGTNLGTPVEMTNESWKPLARELIERAGGPHADDEAVDRLARLLVGLFQAGTNLPVHVAEKLGDATTEEAQIYFQAPRENALLFDLHGGRLMTADFEEIEDPWTTGGKIVLSSQRHA